MSETILQFENLFKSFSGNAVLKDISFTLRQGTLLGLVGENGAGKSTLMNILGGIHEADSGRLVLDGEDYLPRNPADALAAGIAFIHQELNLFTNLSIAENFFIHQFPRIRFFGIPIIDKQRMYEKARPLLKAVNLQRTPDTPVEYLSPAERQLVEIAKALRTEARIIIFDEPTTSLTAHETERLFEIIAQLKAQGISMIFISHNLEDVFRLCDDLMVLRDGEAVGFGARERFDIARVVSLMVGRSIEQFYPSRSTAPTAEVVLDVQNLSQPGVVKDISLRLHQGEILGLFGLMGSGRSELARILYGLDPYAYGKIFVQDKPMSRHRPRQSIRNRLAFLTENRREEGLLLSANVTENVALASLPNYSRTFAYWVHKRRLQADVSRMAEATRVRCASFDAQTVSTLSGGNQQKVVLSKWLMLDPQVLILDEPTRGIDIGAKTEIYNLMNERVAQGAGILLISSEIEELLGMCDRILVMSKGEIKGEFVREDFDRERILHAALEERGE